MSVTARTHRRVRKPGNAITRRIAGLPDIPDIGIVDPVLRPEIAVSVVEQGRIQPPNLSGDLTIPIPELFEISSKLETAILPVDLAETMGGFQIIEVPIGSFGGYQINGALFNEGQKIGTPSEDPRIYGAAATKKRGFRGTSKTAPLLAKLLPILLPPARANFDQAYALPSDLYAYQRDGIEWLIDHEPGALLADDMGLGKTVQTAVALRQLFRTGQALRALVVVPRSVMTSWLRHLEDWSPELRVISIDGSAEERRYAWAALWADRAHIGVVTYDSLRNDLEFAKNGDLSVLILDEVHLCKNPDTGRAKAVKAISAPRRWGLTGTPLQNKIEDFAAVLQALDPGLRFGKFPSNSAVRNAAKKMMIRRRIDEVLTELPPLTSHIEYVDLLPSQRNAYDLAESTGVSRLEKSEVSITNVLALITELKQICNAVGGQSAKTEWLTDYIETATSEDEKTIVFSQYVRTLDLLESDLAGYSPISYTGQMTTNQRQKVVDSFVATSPNDVLLVSLLAGGVGLTLTAANRVVHYDSWWNPAVMAQATARVRRIGQAKRTFETTLVATNTVEERIQRIIDEKRTLFANVVDDLRVDGMNRALSQEELYSLFGIDVTTKKAADKAEPVLESQTPPDSPIEDLPDETPTSVPSRITSTTPFSNAIGIRRIIRNLKGDVWWADPHFSRKGLEELIEELDLSEVNSVKIVSRDLSARDLKDFKRFKTELLNQSIDSDWRIFEDQRLFHDRFLADDTVCYNVPPVNLIFASSAPHSEINETTREQPFEEWWDAAKSVVNV